MRVSVRNCLFVAFASLGCASPALAGTSGVFLPPAPSGPGGEDSIETSTGTRCRQSINNNGAYMDVGMTGTAASPQTGTTSFNYAATRDREATAYVRVTVPLGRRPERIDCAKIYELELGKLRREVELLKLGVK